MTDAAGQEARLRVDRFIANAAPEDAPDAYVFAVAVEFRGGDRWAVTRHGVFALGTDGVWSWERLPSSRADEWIAEHRFPLDKALELAQEAARKIYTELTDRRKEKTPK